MQMLPNRNDGNLSPLGKFLGWLPFIAGGIAVFWFWGSIVPFVKNTLKDTVLSLVYGGILAVTLLTLWHKWEFISMSYKVFLNKITGFFIKMDPLSYMDRFADILTQKLRNLRAAIVSLKGEKISLERQIAEETQNMEKNLKMAKAFLDAGNKAKAGYHSGIAQGCKESIMLYTPNMKRMTSSLKFMEAMDENWDLSISSMRQLIDRKRREWKVLKRNAAVLKQSEEFLRGDTEEGRIYQESIKALEQQVSEKIAYIEDFEKRAKPIMEGAEMEKTIREQDGLAFLDEYMHNDKLLMPDFSNWNGIQDIDYELVKSSSKEGEFKLIK